MLRIGEINDLTVLRITSVGMYLGDTEGFDVLLPNKYIPLGLQEGNAIAVFVYKDGQDRPVATTLKPKIELNSFGFLRVNYVNEHGAFLDWGLEKDLFVPFGEQNRKMEVGRSYFVYMFLDKVSARLVASGKWEKFLSKEKPTFEVGEKVEIVICERTNLGYNALINQSYKGLLYENEIFQSISLGDSLEAYIKNMREDGKIDLTLQKQGFRNTIEPNALLILEKLHKNQGFLPLSDDSTPEEIMLALKMSKKAFKKAIGVLFRQEQIALETEGIRLVKKEITK